jgi:hypothetical protein
VDQDGRKPESRFAWLRPLRTMAAVGLCCGGSPVLAAAGAGSSTLPSARGSPEATKLWPSDPHPGFESIEAGPLGRGLQIVRSLRPLQKG